MVVVSGHEPWFSAMPPARCCVASLDLPSLPKLMMSKGVRFRLHGTMIATKWEWYRCGSPERQPAQGQSSGGDRGTGADQSDTIERKGASVNGGNVETADSVAGNAPVCWVLSQTWIHQEISAKLDPRSHPVATRVKIFKYPISGHQPERKAKQRDEVGAVTRMRRRRVCMYYH